MTALSEKLAMIADKMGCSFTFKGCPLSSEEVFSASGLLPGFVKRADQLSSLCFGYTLGALYKEASEAPLNSIVEFNQQVSDVVRLFCIVDVLEEFAKMAPNAAQIVLDELMYE